MLRYFQLACQFAEAKFGIGIGFVFRHEFLHLPFQPGNVFYLFDLLAGGAFRGLIVRRVRCLLEK
ncbi:hypothetical protein D3C87_1981840 [compost metagenome]